MKKVINIKKEMKEWVESGEWGYCYICFHGFNKARLTSNHCSYCEGWFCSEHGNLRNKRDSCCILHDEVLKKIGDHNIHQMK